jgi:hypothetical protein
MARDNQNIPDGPRSLQAHVPSSMDDELRLLVTVAVMDAVRVHGHSAPGSPPVGGRLEDPVRLDGLTEVMARVIRRAATEEVEARLVCGEDLTDPNRRRLVIDDIIEHQRLAFTVAQLRSR